MSSLDNSTRSHDWTEAFNKLNQLSPVMLSPANGPSNDAERNEQTLSFPVSGSELEAQLDAWANVTFNFDSSDVSGSVIASSATANDVKVDSNLEQVVDLNNILAFNNGSAAASSAGDPFQELYGNYLPRAAPSTSSPSSTKPVKKSRKSSGGPATPISKEEEANRHAIEEDRRRRNTLASARFRIKKKQREAALESTTKELKDRVSSLEKEIGSLRTENKWLRGLIVEKADSKDDTLPALSS